MMTPVFYLHYFFYIPADTKFRAWALIICGSYHCSKELKGKNDSWYHTIDLFISQNHNDFYITKSIFDNIKSIFWYHKFNFGGIKKIQWFWDIKNSVVWYHKIEYVMSQIRFFDNTKSIFDITKSKIICWCHKIGFVISKTWICDITQ